MSEAPLEKVETFVGVHRMSGIGDIRSGSDRPGSGKLFQRQIDEFRADGQVLDSVIHSDMEMVVWLMKQRIPSFMFVAPEVTPPSERPDDALFRCIATRSRGAAS